MTSRFSPGARVTVKPKGRQTAPGGAYIIIRALPESPGPVQYRIKNESEPFERIIDESRIEDPSDSATAP